MSGFARIRARAADRKGGEKVLASLLGPGFDNAKVAVVSDDRVGGAETEAGGGGPARGLPTGSGRPGPATEHP